MTPSPIQSILGRVNQQLSYGIFRPRMHATQPRQPKTWLPPLMLALTILSTVLVGAAMFGTWAKGLTFSIAVLAILGAHECGHYIAAKRWGVPSSLPYFIPMPLSYFGTMGAIIRMRAPITHRKALFDIGIAGPLAGIIVAVPVLIMGIIMAEPTEVKMSDISYQEGNSILYLLIKHLVHGELLPNWFAFGNLPTLKKILLVLTGRIPAGGGRDILLNPLSWAGWIGMFVTALNLMPMGQLDGGHILFALAPKFQGAIGKAFFVAMLGFSFFWFGWIVWVVLATVIGTQHPPVWDYSDLGSKRRVLGYIMIAVFVLTFIPAPISIG